MNSSVLEKKNIEQERPYSKKEILNTRFDTIRKLRIGKMLIRHQECGHFYFAKENGKKEKEVKESNGARVGNCSVCWKMNRTPERLRELGKRLVDDYMSVDTSFFENASSYRNVELEKDFYTWLYNEFNPIVKKDYKIARPFYKRLNVSNEVNRLDLKNYMD